MSRVLRRPMFRMGGPVDSYNTGIVSGLDDEGYADGGRVGFKEGELVTRPPIGSRIASSARYYNPFTEAGISNIGRKIFTGTPGMIARGGATIAGTYPILSTLAVPAATIGGLAYLNRPMNEAELEFMRQNEEILSKETTDPDLYEEYFKGRTEARRRGEEAGQPKLGFFETLKKEPKQTETQQPTGKSKLDELKEFYENELKKSREGYESQIAALKNVDPMEKELKGIERFSDAYRKMLGYDEAKSQSVFDALLAASPAFFQGRNLREAAPQVLKAVSESKAFEQPRNIKQAAAKLAIERESLMSAQRAKGEGEISKIAESLKKDEGKIRLTTLLSQYGTPLTYAGTKTSLETSEKIPPNIDVGTLYRTTDNKYFVLEGGDKKTPKKLKFFSV